MQAVIEIVFPVFMIIGLGYGLKRRGLFDASFIRQINDLVFHVCLPLLLFYKIGPADFSTSFNFNLVIATSSGVGISFLISYLYAAYHNYSAASHGAFCQGSFRGNLAYIGLAIIFNGYGDDGLTRAGILLGFLVPVLNLFAILALVLPQHQQRTHLLTIGKQIILNPLIISSLAGISWSFFQLPIPTILDRALNITTGMTLPLALLSIGGGFSLKKLRGDLAKASLATFIKLAFMPAITALLMYFLGVKDQDFAVGLLMAGAPAAVATYVMASKMGGDEELAGSIVVMSTAWSALTYTILLFSLQLYRG